MLRGLGLARSPRKLEDCQRQARLATTATNNGPCPTDFARRYTHTHTHDNPKTTALPKSATHTCQADGNQSCLKLRRQQGRPARPGLAIERSLYGLCTGGRRGVVSSKRWRMGRLTTCRASKETKAILKLFVLTRAGCRFLGSCHTCGCRGSLHLCCIVTRCANPASVGFLQITSCRIISVVKLRQKYEKHAPLLAFREFDPWMSCNCLWCMWSFDRLGF